ncbi:MAG: polysaccharide pyruvyl transferase family protein [Clostridia bacterium]|nr:polysaccharide pyruvyl transferase family protein [Clostridia bacterium]
MRNIGIVSYNIRCNFTNYGSALQSWALSQSIAKANNGENRPVLIDYCAKVHLDSDPLNPMKKMWDKDSESRRLCEERLDVITENFYKFDKFYTEEFNRTKKAYDYTNFDEVVSDENIDGFVCGSDTIFCVDEFGFDDGFYANFDSMKNGYAISYAASFGDVHLDEESYKELDKRLKNFKAIAIREYGMVPYIKEKVDVRVQKVLDPTLLLEEKDYEKITAPRQEKDKYLLLYARRYNQKMNDFARKLAKENGWKIVEISLRATNDDNTRAFYEAGVEEFLSLVKHAEFVVTNSFHGMIFSVQFKKKFVIFSREQCNTKIQELLELFGLTSQIMVEGNEQYLTDIDYDVVYERIKPAREDSLKYLNEELQKM